MKKSLVALAVMAAAGAVSAQSVTLSGEYAFGYKNGNAAGSSLPTTTANGTIPAVATKYAGFGTDTAAVKFEATEDLGGGLKAKASVSAGGLARGGSVGGEDAAISLSGGFGTILLTTAESGNGLRQRAEAGGPVFNFEGEVFGAASNLDEIRYTSPSFDGFRGYASYTDRGAANSVDAATGKYIANAGLGLGSDGQTVGQPTVGFGALYANGPIDARVDYTNYRRQKSTEVLSTTIPVAPAVQAAGSNDTKDRIRLSGSYDFGVVKLGAGFSRQTRVSLDTTNVPGGTFGAGNLNPVVETALGVSAPFGPVTVGAFYARSKQSSYTNTNNKKVNDGSNKTGFSFGLKYDFSKRTFLTSNIASWKDSVAEAAAAKTNASYKKGTNFEVLVHHKF
jgi:predicted porin